MNVLSGHTHCPSTQASLSQSNYDDEQTSTTLEGLRIFRTNGMSRISDSIATYLVGQCREAKQENWPCLGDSCTASSI